MAVAGPERSGSGTGVPVPSSTTRVRGAPDFDNWLAGCCDTTAVASVIRAYMNMKRASFVAPSYLFESLIASKRACLPEGPRCTRSASARLQCFWGIAAGEWRHPSARRLATLERSAAVRDQRSPLRDRLARTHLTDHCSDGQSASAEAL